MKATQVDRISEEIEAPVRALGLDLEAVELTPAGKRRVLRVAVDQDGGVTLDDVAEATRAISTVLDSSSALGQQPYTLEVTSRGVDRPLTLERHWRRNHDRLVAIVLTDSSTLTGRVQEARAEEVDLDVDGTSTTVAYAEVRSALVQVELNRRAPAVRDEQDDDADETDDDTDDTDDTEGTEEDD